MRPLLLAMPGNEAMADAVANALAADRCPVVIRRFPDEESCVRIDGDVAGRDVGIVCTLDRPDGKLVPLLLLAGAARENGAHRVGLVAPYLAYMRQDQRFRAGEATSARHMAKWIGAQFDWLITVDPHLHRITNLGELYGIPSRVVHAAGAIAEWIRGNVRQPLLVGPDEESAQWVADVAARIGAPHVVLGKTRHGDRDVSVSLPQVAHWKDHSPVLVDDIVSTARTMIEGVRGLRECGMAAPVCVAVHAIFVAGALEELHAAGAARVVSADTVAHSTNAIPVAGPLAETIGGVLEVDQGL
jgi:ribose-phosphate pyrophosphokinase